MAEEFPIVANENDVLIVADLYGTISSVSDSVEGVFGYMPSDLVNRNVELLVPVDLRSKHRDHMVRYGRRPHARTMGIGLELNAVHRDGTLVPVDVSLRVLREQGQTFIRAVVRRSVASLATTDGIVALAARVRQLELTSRTLTEVYELVGELTSGTYSDRQVGIWRHSPSAGGYVLEATHNLPEEFAGLITPREEEGLITRAAFAQGVAVYPGDSTGEQLPQMFRDAGMFGGIAATIGGRYEPFGAITVYFGEEDALSLADAVPLQTIATEMSRFILSAQTEEALSLESELQTKLAEIGRIFSSSNRVEDVYESFAGLVNELIPYRFITLAEIDHSTRTITTKYSVNSDGSDIEGWESGTRHALAGTSAELMVETKSGLYVNFVDPEEFSKKFPGAPDSLAGLTGLLNIPLIVSGVVVGTLTLNTSGDQKFDDDSLQLGERIAAQISGSFLSASLSESLEKEASRRGTLNEIGEVIGSSLDIPSVFPRFVEILGKAITLDYVAITDVDIESGTKIDFLEYGAQKHEPVVEVLGDSVTGLVVETNRLVSVGLETLDENQLLGDQLKSNITDTFSKTGMTAWVAAPLQDQGEAVGVLHVLTSGQDEFGVDDCLFVSQVASRVASAVVNSRLRETAQEYARQQGLLARISRVIGSSLESSDAFDRFAALLSELIPLDRVAISNVDVSNQTAETLYVSSNQLLSGLERTSFRTRGTPTGHTADIGETVVINNAAEGERFSDWVGAARGILSSVTVPMGREGEFARVFQISCAGENSYNPDIVSMIEQVANQIAGAVANQQLYRRSIELSQERERSIRLDAEAARLASVNQAKNDFLNLLTHELKTPLTSIIAFADLMARGSEKELSGRQAQQLQVIQRNAWQLDALIQDLVDVSSIERGNIELEPAATDLSALVSGVIEGLSPNLEQRGQSVEYTKPEGGAEAVVDRQRITQVISNLISNASKYSPKDTTIFVNVEDLDDRVMVSIEDEGPGIPEGDLGQVFELFHRVDNEATRRVPGTGQGLYLVKQLVELHGGTVRIGNRYVAGSGARAVVTLPVEFAG